MFVGLAVLLLVALFVGVLVIVVLAAVIEEKWPTHLPLIQRLMFMWMVFRSRHCTTTIEGDIGVLRVPLKRFHHQSPEFPDLTDGFEE